MNGIGGRPPPLPPTAGMGQLAPRLPKAKAHLSEGPLHIVLPLALPSFPVSFLSKQFQGLFRSHSDPKPQVSKEIPFFEFNESDLWIHLNKKHAPPPPPF